MIIGIRRAMNLALLDAFSKTNIRIRLTSFLTSSMTTKNIFSFFGKHPHIGRQHPVSLTQAVLSFYIENSSI